MELNDVDNVVECWVCGRKTIATKRGLCGRCTHPEPNMKKLKSLDITFAPLKKSGGER